MATFAGIVVPTGGSEGSGRTIFLDVIDELARPIDAADETVRAHAADAFRAAVRTMNRKGLWPWEILDEDVIITANNSFSTVSGPIKKPLAMHLLDGSGGTRDQRLSYMPYDEFMEKYSMDFSSEPYAYTIPNLFETGQIRWYPKPSSADNARFTFYRATPLPRNEQEPIEIPETALGVYIDFAWYEFLKRLSSRQRPFPINFALSRARESFREINSHVNSPGDRVRFSGFGVY
jgi:hypothetical protein